MKDRIEQLRAASVALEPNLQQRSQWTEQTAAHAQQYIESLSSRPVFEYTADEGKGILTDSSFESSTDIGTLLKCLAQYVEATGGRLGSPGFMGFIPISSLYPAALGDYLAAVLNPFAGNFFASPGAVRLELHLTRWMASFIGYPKTSAGDLTSGGSISNLSAIVTAREAAQLKARDYENAVVYLTSQTHHSVTKALRIAGLAQCPQRVLPVDAQYRMQPGTLEQAIHQDKKAGLRPWLVVASAGSTDVGAVDPLKDIAHVSQQHGSWLHVDGAYGAMFALVDSARQRLSGIEESDSLTLDPHKGLFMPCGSGALLVRDGPTLLNAYHYDAGYMRDRTALASLEEVSPSQLSPELTRPFRALRLWLSLKLVGLPAFRAALKEKLLLAEYFYEKLRQLSDFETGPSPDLSVVIFRFLPSHGDADDFNRRLLRAIQTDGRIFLTSTILENRVWLRLAVLCAATHLEHIELALTLLQEKAQAIITG